MDKSIREHDAVALLRDIPAHGLVAGDTGVAVYAYENGHAFEVEFANPNGQPRFLAVTVEAKDLLKLQPRGRIRAA